MNKTHVKKTGEIIATDDEGNRYTIIQFTQSLISRGFAADSTEVVQGFDTFRLSDGEPIHRISDTEFFIARLGTALHVVT